MGFKAEAPDRVEAVAFARDSSAAEVLRNLNYLTEDQFTEHEPYTYPGDVYSAYRVTIIIEPA